MSQDNRKDTNEETAPDPKTPLEDLKPRDAVADADAAEQVKGGEFTIKKTTDTSSPGFYKN